MIRAIARMFLRANGWELEGCRPADRRFVLIAAPHTSNWDLAYLLALAVSADIEISWMGKHVLFRPPLGWLARAAGGIPIFRHERGNVVSQMVEQFDRNESLALVVPAEGTRGYVSHWKSGFYHIASKARVPIVLGYLDYARRRGGFGPALHPTGDVQRDMDVIRDFYADIQGKYPDSFGEVRLAEEG